MRQELDNLFVAFGTKRKNEFESEQGAKVPRNQLDDFEDSDYLSAIQSVDVDSLTSKAPLILYDVDQRNPNDGSDVSTEITSSKELTTAYVDAVRRAARTIVANGANLMTYDCYRDDEGRVNIFLVGKGVERVLVIRTGVTKKEFESVLRLFDRLKDQSIVVDDQNVYLERSWGIPGINRRYVRNPRDRTPRYDGESVGVLNVLDKWNPNRWERQ